MLEMTSGPLVVKVDPANRTVQLNGMLCTDEVVADVVTRMGEGKPFVVRVTPRTAGGYVAPSFEELRSDNGISATDGVLYEIFCERQRQVAKWGEQNHPSIDRSAGSPTQAERDHAMRLAREECDRAAAEGRVTWEHIAKEEFKEALATMTTSELRAELVQTTAVLVAWIECIDRNAGAEGDRNAQAER